MQTRKQVRYENCGEKKFIDHAPPVLEAESRVAVTLSLCALAFNGDSVQLCCHDKAAKAECVLKLHHLYL